MQGGVCRGKEGLSAQLSPSVRGEFLPSGEGYSKAGGSLGHASIETTRIYVMESAESHIRQIERMRLYI